MRRHNFHRRPYRYLPIAMLAILALLMAACGGEADPVDAQAEASEPAGETDGGGGAGAGEAAANQDLSIGISSVIRNFDPISTTAISDYLFLRFVYDTLVSVDSGSPEPWAAESWEAIAPDHWRFKIREGITFTNGEPLDARAVEFTFQRALDDPENPWRVRIEALESMEIIDDYTIDFHLSAPVGNWPTRLAVVWIVPPEHTGETDVLVGEPVGSGPFVLESFSPGEEVVLTSNPDWWNGAPALETVTLRSIPEESTRVSTFLAGDIDVAHRILPDFVPQIESAGEEVVSVPSGQSANIFFQSSKDNPLADVRVRQAIDYALDKEAIFEGITGGYGRFLEGQIVGPNSVGYNPDVEARPYDPERAQELLAEAGYGDGVELAFDYPQGRYFRDKEMGELISGYLDAVGITVAQNPMEGGAWLDRLYTGDWGPINYWSIQDAPAYDLSWTMEIFKTDNLRQLTADEELDRQIEESFNITDQEERNAYLADFAEYLHEQTHFVSFHQDPGLYAVSSRVEGIEFLPSTYIDLFDARIVE